MHVNAPISSFFAGVLFIYLFVKCIIDLEMGEYKLSFLFA